MIYQDGHGSVHLYPNETNPVHKMAIGEAHEDLADRHNGCEFQSCGQGCVGIFDEIDEGIQSEGIDEFT